MPESTRNFFELFDLPPSFAIDLDELTARYRNLQRAAHPDKYAHASDQERRLAVQTAANINDAFRTLKDPVERALYLLHMKGFPVDAESSRRLAPEFLMEQMELREALDDIRSGSGDSRRLAELLKKIASHERDIIGNLTDAFQRNGADALRDANQHVQQLRFVRRLSTEAHDVDEQLNG